MLDDNPAGDSDLRARTLEPPAHLDVLPGDERPVETVLEQSRSVEDRRNQAEPMAAHAGPMVMSERAAPISRAGRALEAGLKRGVSTRAQLIEQGTECSGRDEDIGIDHRDPGCARRFRPDEAGGCDPPALVSQDASAVAAGDLDRGVGGEPVDDDHLRRALSDHRTEAFGEE